MRTSGRTNPVERNHVYRDMTKSVPPLESGIEFERQRAMQIELRLLKARIEIETMELLHAQQLAEREAELSALKHSQSWRLTAPFRAARNRFQGEPTHRKQPRNDAGQDTRTIRRIARLAASSASRLRARLLGDVVVSQGQGRARPAETSSHELPANHLLGEQATSLQCLDLFSEVEVAQCLGAQVSSFLPLVADAEAINDEASAALFCVALLRTDPALRERFPHALSAGADGSFAAWLRLEGACALGLSASALAAIERAFLTPPGARPRQIYFLRPDLRTAFPFATLPVGCGGFLGWLVENGCAEYALQPHEIWWFVLECAEDAGREMRLLYLLTPHWQQMFPDATTRFGRARFTDWLHTTLKLQAPWTEPAEWPDQPTPGDQIRIAWQARPDWRERFPEALEDMDQARALLSWLGEGAKDLPGDVRSWCASLEPEATARAICARGVNVIGHFCYPSGLRTSVQSIVDGLQRADRAVSLRDVPVDRHKDEPIHHHFVGLEHHDTTLLHIQPDPHFRDAYFLSGLHPRQPRSYRIGYWYWEMDTVPETWKPAVLQTDELWAATRFVADALKSRLDQPVFTLAPGMALAPFERRGLAYFGVPAGKFVFLFVFHMMSVMERKNPLGLIRAFSRAFGPHTPVVLVLKITFGEHHPQLMEKLRRAAAEAPAEVVIIDQVYTQDETLSLIDACDSYVSLHRSEGLGLTMAEAMLLGKPVIATRFSGNLDFMSDTSSLLVDCDIVKVGRSVPPYEAHMCWAEPSEECAAHLMRRVFEERDFAMAMGQRARTDLETNHSLVAAGRRMADRLDAIRDEQQRWKRAGLERPSFIGRG